MSLASTLVERYGPALSYVRKRDGTIEPLSVHKLAEKFERAMIGYETDPVDLGFVAMESLRNMNVLMSLSHLDMIVADSAFKYADSHPAYETLATRLELQWLHRITPSTFSEAMDIVLSLSDVVVTEKLRQALALKHELDIHIRPERDFDMSFCHLRSLEHCYLIRREKRLVETPQYLFMRTACSIIGADLPRILDMYDILSLQFFAHAKVM